MIGGTGFILKYGVSHLSCSSSSQHYLQELHKVSNSVAKSICEISDRVCLHPLTNKLHLWYWLPLKQISCGNILQFVTDVQRMGVFGKLIQCLFYPAFLLLTSLPPCVWAIVLLTIILLLFMVYVLKFPRYIVLGNYLTQIFSRKCDPSQSILASIQPV